MIIRTLSAAIFASLLLGQSARAQESDIVIGASLPLTGFNAGPGQEALRVMKAYFDQVNATGGIGGRRIALDARDDAFDAAKSAENARAIAKSKAVALFNCWGTSSCSAIMPIITENGLPLVSGISGGGPMRLQPGRFAFNIRPATDAELGRMVDQMALVGQTNIALVFQNDPFGKSGQTAMASVMGARKAKLAAELSIERDGSNAAAVVEALSKLPKLNGVVIVAAPPATVKLIPAARAGGLGVQFYNLAAQANRKLVSDLGVHTANVVFTTLVPSPWRESVPIVREYRELITASTGKADVSYLGMEIYINARVLVDGLRKAGRGVTRESLVTALETLGERRYGPLTLDYSGGKRSGSTYVGLTMAGKDGRFIE